MLHQRIKNIILIIMVLVCIYLSSKVWLQLPDFLVYDFEQRDDGTDKPKPNIDFWNVVKPIKNIIKYKDNYTVLYSENEYNFWKKTVEIVDTSFRDFDNSIVLVSAAFPSNYLKFDFPTNMPIQIFTGQFEIKSDLINSTIKNIKNLIIDLDNKNCIYIYNGENTIKIENNKIDTEPIANTVKKIDFNKYTKYSVDEKIGEENIKIPVPLEKVALNPVFVQSELDVFDTEAINKIAKDYFKNNYEYVRKVVEVSGNMVYMYRTQMVLKIKSEGLLDFYDSNIEPNNNADIYESLIKALNFTEDFLGFPKDGYISKVEQIQKEGNYGYKFTFSYKILERPILFSRVRENSALEIDVIGDSVVSYKRFIRNIDETQMDKMLKIEILPVTEVLSNNILSEQETELTEIKPLTTEMIKDISNIYLGYFDLSRIAKEQVLRVVWVVEIEEKSFIFNAITGKLIEEW